MKTLQDYIIEGIFDIEDNMDKIDRDSASYYWSKQLMDINKYPQNVNTFIKDIIKNGAKKVSKNNLDESKAYVCVKKEKISDFDGGGILHIVNFIYPNEKNGGWLIAGIRAYIYDDNSHTNEINYINTQLLRSFIYNINTIYELPEDYFGIIYKIASIDKK